MADYNLVNPPVMVSPDQVAQSLLQAGFTPEEAAQMTAVSIGNEDPSGNASVVNDNPATGDYSVGLFQINYYGDLRPGRTAEFGAPESLAGNPQAQASAAKTLFDQGGYSPWQADFTGGGATRTQAALPAAIQAVNDAQKGTIVTPNSVMSSTGSQGYVTATQGSGYQPAATAFGKVLQEVDAFYNPGVTLLPSWGFIGSGVSDVVKLGITAADRIVGLLMGAGLVYIGVKLFASGGSSSGGSRYGAVPTAIRATRDITTGREANAVRLAVAERRSGDVATRTTSQERVASQRATQQEAQRTANIARDAVRAREQAANREARIRENNRRAKATKRRISLQEQAEARRQAEDRNATLRVMDRPTRPTQRRIK